MPCHNIWHLAFLFNKKVEDSHWLGSPLVVIHFRPQPSCELYIFTTFSCYNLAVDESNLLKVQMQFIILIRLPLSPIVLVIIILLISPFISNIFVFSKKKLTSSNLHSSCIFLHVLLVDSSECRATSIPHPLISACSICFTQPNNFTFLLWSL